MHSTQRLTKLPGVLLGIQVVGLDTVLCENSSMEQHRLLLEDCRRMVV